MANRPIPLRPGRIALIVALSAVLLPTLGPLLRLAGAANQAATTVYLPDLPCELKPTSGFVLFGQEGLGNAVVDVLNRSDAANSARLDLWPKSGTSPATLIGSLDPHALARFDLDSSASVTGGFYAGRLTGSGDLGAIARIGWVSGASAAYEAAPAARDFIVPLVARAVYSHTTILYAQNADPGPDSNGITLAIYDGESGLPLTETVSESEPEETVSWDTAHAAMTFGRSTLGSNAPTGGWLGSVWLRSGKLFAVMAYGDEMASQGSSAYVGRPASAADATQYMPLIRRNCGGDTLIAIANAANRAVEVDIEYRGAPFSPSGANEMFAQHFSIGPRGSAFVDLSERGRGTRPQPELPRGETAGGGFVGSAILAATGPVLAVAQDEQLQAGTVESVSAYNAFGPADLGTSFGATNVRRELDYQSTAIYLYNPGYAPIECSVDFFDRLGAPSGSSNAAVAAGSLARVSVSESNMPRRQVGRAELGASGPFAALVYDERDPLGVPEEKTTSAYLRALNDSHVGGIARFTERGSDTQVDLELSGTWPGARYTASINRGECDTSSTKVHDLTAPTEGKSATMLHGVAIADLTDRAHCVSIVAEGWPGRPAREVSCGGIVPAPGAEVVDTTISWPVRLAAGGPIVSPTPAPPTFTPSPTRPPTAVPTATPTRDPSQVTRAAYLPALHRMP